MSFGVNIGGMPPTGLTPADILTAVDRLVPGARTELRLAAPAALAGAYDMLILVKPEVFRAAGAGHAIGVILTGLGDAGITIVRACAFSGGWAAASGCIRDCYLPLYTYAKGSAALDDPMMRVVDYANANRSTVADVVTGTAVLAREPAWSAEALATLCEVAGVVKLGAGLYVSPYTALDGTHRALVNGFQPHHEAHMTAPGATLVALHVRSGMAPSVLRERVIGGIAPAAAVVDSIRHRLWLARDVLGFTPTVTYNCVHVSPGILEAAFHIGSFFLDPPEAALERVTAGVRRAPTGRLAEALVAPRASARVPLLIDAFGQTEALGPDAARAWFDAHG